MVVAGAIGSLVVVTGYLISGAPGVDAISRPPPIDAAAKDPMLRAHITLQRSDQEYKERLESLAAFADAYKLAEYQGNAGDSVLSATAQLIRQHGSSRSALTAAERQLSRQASGVASLASRSGISVGPGLRPEVVKSRLRDSDSETSASRQICAFQQSACAVLLLRNMPD